MALAQSNGKNNKPNVGINDGGDAVAKPTTFHDFLGSKGQGQTSSAVRPTEASPSAASDLGSERNTGSHLEGIPFYGSRGDISGPESSSRFPGNKRNHSDFIMPTRDKLQVDSQDSPLLSKLLRYSGGELPRRPHDEETAFRAHKMRSVLASVMPQPSSGVRTDAHSSKWDTTTAVNAGPMSQHAPHISQFMPFGYQTASNRFKDTNSAGPSLMSQTAADEGSRTGIKGSRVLSSTNATGAVLGRQPAGVLVRIGKQKLSNGVSEPESSATAPSQQGMQSAGSQMTIFYCGQAHVFDNVHSSKADAIMALARSSGASWSTSYASDSAARQSSAENMHDKHAGVAALREAHWPSDKGDSRRGFGSGD